MVLKQRRGGERARGGHDVTKHEDVRERVATQHFFVTQVLPLREAHARQLSKQLLKLS